MLEDFPASDQVAYLQKLANGLQLPSVPQHIPHFKQCLPEGCIKTRSFTSLGTYNNNNAKCAVSKGGSISVWEAGSMGHQSQGRVHSAESPRRGFAQYGARSNQNRLRWVDALNTWVPDTRMIDWNFTTCVAKSIKTEIPKDLSVESPDGLNVGNEGQNGNRWQQDSPSQAFVTFVNGAPANQHGSSTVSQDSLYCEPSTSKQMYCTTRPLPEHSNPFRRRFLVGKVRNRPSTSHELHRTRAKPDPSNPVTSRSPGEKVRNRPSTSHELHRITTKPEHSNAALSAVENVRNRPNTSHELHRTRAKPHHANHDLYRYAVDNVRNRPTTSHELHRTRAKPQPSNLDLPAMNIHPQRSEEIYVKVDKPRETATRRVCRSQTALPVRNFTQKRSTFRAPPSRQSRSSAAPPPSTTPGKSANSIRSSTASHCEGNAGGITLPPTVVEKTTAEDKPTASLAHGGPGGDESGASTHLDAQSDKDSSVLSKPHTHSRHGSTSSINTDLSVHSKTSSAYFMENILDEPVSAPVEIKAQEVLSPVDRPSPEVTFTPSPVVLPSIISFPSPILPAPALDLTPAPLPVTPHIPDPPSPPTKGQEVQAHQRGITPSPPKTNLCSVSQSQPPTLDSQHERKKFGVRWDTDSLTNKSGSTGTRSEQDAGSIVNGAETICTTDHTRVEPRPLTPPLTTIKETEPVEVVSRDITDGNNILSKIQLQKVDTLNKNSNSSADITKPVVTRKPLPKKVKRERKAPQKTVQKPKMLTPPASPSPTPSMRKLSLDSVISGVPGEEKESSFDADLPSVVIPDIPLPSILEGIPEAKLKIKNQMALPPTSKPKRNVRHRKASLKQSSYEEERMRQELAERRRKKQQFLLERLKMKTYPQPREECTQIEKDSGPRFEDYDFLAKYCIFDKGSHHTFKEAFQSVDTENPWLSGRQVISALKSLNTKLSEVEDEYLWRILELMGYDVSKGADFKLFSVIAALSKRISALDDWMKDLIGKIDFASLELRMDLWKTLWECNVDTESNTVSLDQLCVELQAGGISRKHQIDVRKKLGHLTSLDLLDFLTYIPLFVIIHESVVENPLSNK